MVSYSICLSLSDFFHSAYYSRSPSLLFQMARFHSFLWPSSTPLYVYTCAVLCCAKSLQSSNCVTTWTVACQAPLSTGFSRQEYWSGVLFPSSRDLSDPGIKHASLMSPELAGGLFKPHMYMYAYICIYMHIFCNHMDGSWRHYAKRNRWNRGGQSDIYISHIFFTPSSVDGYLG